MEIVDEANRLAKVDVAGVQRTINIGLLDGDGDGAQPGDWVLIHVGFALSKVDEEEAEATLKLLEGMGADYEQELAELQGERDRVSDCDHDVCITCGDVAVPMRVVRVDGDLAVCEAADGDVRAVEIALVEPVDEGDTLLVHADVALQVRV